MKPTPKTHALSLLESLALATLNMIAKIVSSHCASRFDHRVAREVYALAAFVASAAKRLT
jgi:hypothetical protein